MSAAEVVADGLAFPEGPAWCDDGTVVVVAVASGTVHRVRPATGEVERIADPGGGPNAALLASDGGIVITQNGGVDFAGRFPDVAEPRRVAPGIQHIAPDGQVSDVWARGALAPNDLAVTGDGALWWTDPGPVPPVPGRRIGRVLTLPTDGDGRVVCAGLEFCNGIAVMPAGDVVVVEQRGLLRVADGGMAEWVVRDVGPGGADGFAVDVDGRYYVAAARDHVVRVLDPDGSPVEVIELPGDGFTTNCCFGGDDLRTLFVTDGLPGRLLAWEGAPAPGLPLRRWERPGGDGESATVLTAFRSDEGGR